MSKYLGPILKKLRALGLPLPRFRKKGSNPPGQHGGKKKRLSPYGILLREKQKVMYSYGWRDKQLKSEYIKAKSEGGDVGINLLVSSESRLDNLVFKSGLVNTLGFARQLVSYNHILVDGKKVNIPSYKVEPRQVISLRKEKMLENKIIKDSLKQNIKTPAYISFDRQKMLITYLHRPTPEEVRKDIDTSLVAEWYHRKV